MNTQQAIAYVGTIARAKKKHFSYSLVEVQPDGSAYVCYTSDRPTNRVQEWFRAAGLQTDIAGVDREHGENVFILHFWEPVIEGVEL